METQQYRSDMKENSSDSLISGIMENISEYVWLVALKDGKLSILYHSPSINKLTGYTPDEIRTNPSHWLRFKGERGEKNIERVLKQGIPGKADEITIEHTVLCRGQKTVWVSTRLKRHEASGVSSWLCVSRDISKTKKELLKLTKARNDAEAASRAKSEFLASKSHEIRTPLGILLGLTELLGDTKLTRKQEHYLTLMESNAEVLLSLINNIIDVSRIEAGKMELGNVSFCLGCIVESVSDILGPGAAKKSVDILCFIDPKLPLIVRGDPTRLRRVLLNLAGNAVKFTESGTVTIRVKAATSPEERHSENILTLHVSVTDTGVGIPLKEQKKIFNIFTQAPSSRGEMPAGSGMGLHISKALVELMGGRIWVNSIPEAGTSFHFTASLMYDRNNRKSLAQSISPELSRLSALIVCDNTIRRSILGATLFGMGIQLNEAVDSGQTLPLLGKVQPDILLIDLDVSGGNGMKLARQVRRERRFDGVSIVLLFARGEVPSKLLVNLNISGALSKPFKRSKLVDILKVIPGASPPANSPRCAKRPVSKGEKFQLKILLVDDNPESHLITRSTLVKNGYLVDKVSNGKEAVTAIRKHIYALVIMDIKMPVMDGFEATRQIRAFETESERVPVIALSAHGLTEFKKKGFKSGVDAYLTKPIKGETLLRSVEKWIDTRPVALVLSEHIRSLQKIFRRDKKRWRLIFAENGNDVVEKSMCVCFSIIVIDTELAGRHAYNTVKRVSRLSVGPAIIIALIPPYSTENKKWTQAGCKEVYPKNLKWEELEKVFNKYLYPKLTSREKKPESGPDLEDLKPRFLQSRIADLRKIESLLEKGSYDEIERVGHNMKGVGYAFGFYRIGEIGGGIEEAASGRYAKEIKRQTSLLALLLTSQKSLAPVAGGATDAF